MTATLGAIETRATQELFATVSNPSGVPSGFDGWGIQFAGDSSLLDRGQLPAGYTVDNFGIVVAFDPLDSSQSTCPNLPTRLLPLAQYAPYPDTGGFFYVDILDAQGRYVDTSGGAFRLTALHPQAVPEPMSVAVFGGLLAAGAWVVRRQRR